MAVLSSTHRATRHMRHHHFNSPMMIKIEKHDPSCPPNPIMLTFFVATNFSVLFQIKYLIIPMFGGYECVPPSPSK